MGSVGFDGERNCNSYILPATLHVGRGEVNHASVPQKLRTAIKKRGLESTAPPLPISKKQRRLPNRVGAPKNEGGKRSKPKRQGNLTKDEEEVAETLYALANMFPASDTANQLGLHDEPADAKSKNAVGDTGLLIPREESRNISSKVTLEASKDNLLDSKSQFFKVKSYSGGELSSSKQSSSPAGGSQVRLPAWLNSTKLTPQTTIIENCTYTEKSARAVVQSKKMWKRSTTHVYIGRLIKVMQISERKEGSPARNDILRHNRLIQDRQLASDTSASCSATEGYDFLSMGTQVGGLNTNGDENRAGHSNKALEQFKALYMQSQNHPGVLFSLPHNVYSSTLHGHNSALAAPQAQVLQYHSSSTLNGSFMAAQMGRQLDLPGWKTENVGPPSGVNNGQALFPHLLGYSKYQQLPDPHPMSVVCSSMHIQNVKMNQHQFPMGFDRNGTCFL